MVKIEIEKDFDDFMKHQHRMEIVEDEDEGGYAINFPDLPGCITCADTLVKALQMAVDAKACWFYAYWDL